MKLGEQAFAGMLGVLACAGLLWAGIGFAGFSLMTALAPGLGLAAAAAVTALVLLIIPAIVVIFYRRPVAEASAKAGADNVLSAIAQIAKERPLLAMVGAALFGAAEVFLSQRKKKK
jgi:hypothetical protein